MFLGNGCVFDVPMTETDQMVKMLANFIHIPKQPPPPILLPHELVSMYEDMFGSQREQESFKH